MPDVLAPGECAELIARIEREGPVAAPIMTPRGPRVTPGVRNNERVMFDDVPLAQLVFERIREHAPPEVHGMGLIGANERFRCYRYRPGMRFAMHADGAFHRDEWEQSWYTLLVYLNHDFEGGETRFFVEPEVSIRPYTGMALLFQHPIVHEGAEVQAGAKYVLRTDLMYRMAEGGNGHERGGQRAAGSGMTGGGRARTGAGSGPRNGEDGEGRRWGTVSCGNPGGIFTGEEVEWGVFGDLSWASQVDICSSRTIGSMYTSSRWSSWSSRGSSRNGYREGIARSPTRASARPPPLFC
ncbi:MAG: 2OG-Fe(II) oxygenase [Alphaproteobacteria bacterium]|nr:2OG-Fe(II) oxygenase [Alphaproteobacteria bacterium]MCB9699730.1 2OG-Fe(II) oxygenase [Alphaproteobacteria bacterium]